MVWLSAQFGKLVMACNWPCWLRLKLTLNCPIYILSPLIRPFNGIAVAPTKLISIKPEPVLFDNALVILVTCNCRCSSMPLHQFKLASQAMVIDCVDCWRSPTHKPMLNTSRPITTKRGIEFKLHLGVTVVACSVGT